MEIHSLQELDQALKAGMVLAIDDGTVTSKVDVATIEKHAIETYAGSTLAGSAQSVKTALDGIKTDLNVVYGANSIKTLAATDDLLTLDVGMYRVENVLPLNAPSTTYKYGYATKQHRGASGYTYYEFIVGNGNGNDFKRYYGWQYSNSASAIDWIEMAPQSAVDALNSKNAGTTYTSVEDLYNYGINTPGFKFATITSAVASSLTNGVIASASRIFLCRADNTTVDALLFSLSSGKIYLSRIANGVAVKAYSASVTEISLS